MITTPNISTSEKQETVSIKRTFNLPLSNVWKAWTDPESFKKWWGPKGYTCLTCTIDFKVGGLYLNSMQAADGHEIWTTGIYKEIMPLEKLVYTDSFADSKGNIVPASFYKMPGEWALELIVTVEFKEVKGRTNITLEQVGLPAEMGEECMKGWQSSFDKLEASANNNLIHSEKK